MLFKFVKRVIRGVYAIIKFTYSIFFFVKQPNFLEKNRLVLYVTDFILNFQRKCFIQQNIQYLYFLVCFLQLIKKKFLINFKL